MNHLNVLLSTQNKCLNKALRALLTLQETRSIHDSMNIPKIEFISYMKLRSISMRLCVTVIICDTPMIPSQK